MPFRVACSRIQMREATGLPNTVERAEQRADDKLLPLVYEELRRFATPRMKWDPHDVTKAEAKW